MLNENIKRILSFFLVLCMMISLIPTTVFAENYIVGDTTITNTNEAPTPIENAVWVLFESDECKKVEHSHGDKCYYHSCDHNDGHLSTCYGENVEYAACSHDNDTQHTATVTLSDVVTISGTSVSWKKDHPAYPVVHAVYKVAYDEAYANAKYGKEYAKVIPIPTIKLNIAGNKLAKAKFFLHFEIKNTETAV
jgi:hypothetical protein